MSETLETKLALAGLYKTEVRDDPLPSSIAGLRGWARQWGRLFGLLAAEASVLQRYVEGEREGLLPTDAARRAERSIAVRKSKSTGS